MVKIFIIITLLLGIGVLLAKDMAPVTVEIDTFMVFTEDISLKDARAKTLQFARECAMNKAIPVEVSISSLITDMYVEKNKCFDEATAKSIFMMSSSAGRFNNEKIIKSYPIFEGAKGTFQYKITYQATIVAVEKAYNSAFDLNVDLSSTLLNDGSEFSVDVKSNRDGFLYIFNFLSDNSVALIYPHLNMKDNTLRKDQSWKQSIGAVADPTHKITIETLYFVFSTEPISGWEMFRSNSSATELVFSAGDESFILFQKWLARSDPSKRVEKMAQLHIMGKE